MNQAYLEFERYIKNKRVDVIGIGVSNTPVIDLLLSMGADVCARDVKPREEKKELAEVLEKKGVRTVFGEMYLQNIDADFILKAPGIRPDREELVEAVRRGRC